METYRAFSITTAGASHLQKGIICQDSSGAVNYPEYSATVVCDGHGGQDYFRSHIGSFFAKEAFFNSLCDDALFEYCRKANTQKQYNQILVQLEKCIISEWNSSILEHYLRNPFTEEELYPLTSDSREEYERGEFIERAYGTTLIASVVTEDFWFCIHIGDGKCVVLDKNQQCIQPVPWDERCFLNNTTSLCDMDAISCFRHYFSTEIPEAVFISCDGVDNSFTDNDAFNDFYKLVASSFSDMNFDNAVQELSGYLPVLSEKGSGDDISVGGIINTNIYHC